MRGLGRLGARRTQDRPNRSRAAFVTGHPPGAPRQVSVSQNRHIHRVAPGPRISPTSTRDISRSSSPRSSGVRSESASCRVSALAADTRSAVRRPEAVNRSETDRPSRPGRRVTKPASSSRSTSLTVPEGVSPSTWRSRSTDGSSRKWCIAESATAADSDCPSAPPTAAAVRSVSESDNAPRRLPVRSSRRADRATVSRRRSRESWTARPRAARGTHRCREGP